MKKRIFALATALLMTFAIMPATSFASETSIAHILQQQQPEVRQTSATTPFQPSTKYTHQAIRNTIAKYKPLNNDVVGWLLIPNTNMSMPILQHAKDNGYYESRDINGVYYPHIDFRNPVITATYLDFRSKFGPSWRNMTSRNTVLYGHNWNNLRAPFDIGNHPRHTMFGQLPSYTSLEFATANPHIYFSTDELEGIWRVFAVGYSELSTDFFYNNPNPNDEAFAQIINEWKQRSIFNFGVEVDATDRILTLSTCTRQYGSFPQQRYVVVARLLRPGESENDIVSVTVNPNPKQPKF